LKLMGSVVQISLSTKHRDAGSGATSAKESVVVGVIAGPPRGFKEKKRAKRERALHARLRLIRKRGGKKVGIRPGWFFEVNQHLAEELRGGGPVRGGRRKQKEGPCLMQKLSAKIRRGNRFFLLRGDGENHGNHDDPKRGGDSPHLIVRMGKGEKRSPPITYSLRRISSLSEGMERKGERKR